MKTLRRLGVALTSVAVCACSGGSVAQSTSVDRSSEMKIRNDYGVVRMKLPNKVVADPGGAKLLYMKDVTLPDDVVGLRVYLESPQGRPTGTNSPAYAGSVSKGHKSSAGHNVEETYVLDVTDALKRVASTQPSALADGELTLTVQPIK